MGNLDPQNMIVLVGLVSTLIGTTWKLGRLVERIETSTKHLEALPTIRQDLEQVKLATSHLTSDVRELKEDKVARDAVARWSHPEIT